MGKTLKNHASTVAPPADHRTGTFKLAGRRSEKMREAAELLSLEKLRERGRSMK
jgi:hypothetical protein